MPENDGKWTFACELVMGWTAPLYPSKEDAINNARVLFPTAEYITVGQIKSFCGAEYIENTEDI